MFKLKHFWPYILFFCTIVLLVVANRANIKKEIQRNLTYTKTLNLSGKQRMFSQKLTKLSYEAKNGKDVSLAMKQALTQWEKTHYDLINSENGVAIYADGHPETLKKMKGLSPYLAKLSSDFKEVANGHVSEEILQRIDENEQEYLTEMDAVVTAIEQDAATDLLASEKKQKLLALISGIILVLEMIIFVYPYHKRLIKAYKKVKRQQDELEEQNKTIEHLYETNELIIKGTHAGIWEWDIKTGEENWTDRFFELLGYKRGDIDSTYDTFLNKLLHPDDREKILHAVDLHLKDRTPYKHEVRMLHKNGEYVWYETSGQAVWSKQGEPLRMAGSIIDISERVSTRQKLLTESNTKDKLLSIITHDLRSPVNNLKALLALLKENVINKEEFLEQIKATSTNVDELSTSMDNILTWAQGQVKGWKVTPTSIVIDDVVKECIRLYQASIKDKKIELVYDPEELINAYADFNQMVLIVRNILNNAVKFTPEKGKVSIITKQHDNFAEIVISDTGRGMDNETIKKVLSKGSIFSTKGTKGEKGTGLGMNMCLEFADRNNCKIDIDSKENEGTNVSLLIPQKQ